MSIEITALNRHACRHAVRQCLKAGGFVSGNAFFAAGGESSADGVERFIDNRIRAGWPTVSILLTHHDAPQTLELISDKLTVQAVLRPLPYSNRIKTGKDAIDQFLASIKPQPITQ